VSCDTKEVTFKQHDMVLGESNKMQVQMRMRDQGVALENYWWVREGERERDNGREDWRFRVIQFDFKVNFLINAPLKTWGHYHDTVILFDLG
jgi:hypothetical protein